MYDSFNYLVSDKKNLITVCYSGTKKPAQANAPGVEDEVVGTKSLT